jgi:hypothetical protein
MQILEDEQNIISAPDIATVTDVSDQFFALLNL